MRNIRLLRKLENEIQPDKAEILFVYQDMDNPDLFSVSSSLGSTDEINPYNGLPDTFTKTQVRAWAEANNYSVYYVVFEDKQPPQIQV